MPGCEEVPPEVIGAITMNESPLRNPHLEGGPFFWKGGRDGILLIHGFTATTAEVRPLGQYLHSLGYTVAGPLLPGHFAQPRDINRYRWQDWVQTVSAAYEELKCRCERVVVGGESTGAVLSLHLALTHPEIEALLVYAPATRLRMRRQDVARIYAIAPFVAAIPKRMGPPSEADELWQGYNVNPLKGIRELLRLQRQVLPHLGALRQPIFIAQGRLDGTVHPLAPKEIYDQVSSTLKELHWLEQSAHCVALDCERQDLFALTNRFLEQVLRTTEAAS
jgi:carboxylesterase